MGARAFISQPYAKAPRAVRPLERTQIGNGVRKALSAFLLSRHPQDTGKLVARDIADATGLNVEPDTIYRWATGERFPMRPEHHAALCKTYGQSFIDALWVPAANDHHSQEVQNARTKIAALRASLDLETRRLNELAGGAPFAC